MTTSEFIKLLQKEDPEGTAHLRIDGGVPIGVTLKEGYWDGPYAYMDGKQMVFTTKGMKVDVYSQDTFGHVWDGLNWDSYNEPEPTMEDVRNKLFRFEYSYLYPSQNDERAERAMSGIKEALDHYIAYQKDSDFRYLCEIIEKAKKGWRFFEPEKKERGYYDWLVLDEKGKNQGACWAYINPIFKSGKFLPEDLFVHAQSNPRVEDKKYREWKLK